MKLLIVSHNYFPSRNARAFRWSALAEHWVANGHQVQVVTAAMPGLPEKENICGVLVHRVGGKGIESIRARHTSGPSSLLKRALKVVHDLTWKKLYWPDSTALWIRPALSLSRSLLVADQAQVLVTVSIPFSSHVIGYFLKKNFPAVRWIMDIGDPFAFMVEAPTNNHTIYGSLNFAAEGRILSRANAVSVTTEGTLRRYVATYPDVAGKIVEIPPLANVAPPHHPIAKQPGAVRLVFLGTMYRDVRGPEHLLTLFERMAQRTDLPIEMHFYGNHSAYAGVLEQRARKLSGRIFLHGLVDRSEALEAMQHAAVLVNIGNDTTYQLPSKLVEYACFQKPILNVVSRANDSSVAFLKTHPCVFSVIGDAANDDAVADQAIAFVQEARGSSACRMDERWLERFTLQSIAAEYERLLIQYNSGL